MNKYREMLRIGVRDLLGAAPLTEITGEISALAEASVEGAVDSAHGILRARHGMPLLTTEREITRPAKFCVLGMGKLGGDELNYSSDIDLFYLYSSHEGMTTGRRSASGGYREAIENHRFFVKVGEMITAMLNDRTEHGIVFRVDLRLRPEGESGEIAYSLPSLDVYYQAWGRTVDRLALLKAKPISGERRLGEEFMDMMTPFIYRRHLDYTALEEIGVLKDKIDRHAAEAQRGVRDVKLGRGGIREIEFLLQSQQLIHGGRNPALREKNSLRALERLMQNGHLAERDAQILSDAYIFLRNVEHRVQLVEERQTQTLPAKEEELAKLAWAMDFTRDGLPDVKAFDTAFNRHTDLVHEQFEKLFFVPRSQAAVPEQPESELLSESMTEEAALPILGKLGFTDPKEAYRNLILLRDGPAYEHFSDTCRHLLRQIAPRLVSELASVPDPDAALLNFSRFISRVGARASYYSMLAGNPAEIRLLAVLFGSSPFLSGLLIRQPYLLDILVSGVDLSAVKERDVMEEEVGGLLVSSPSFEDELIVMRKYRNGELLRIGLGDLLGIKELSDINRELTTMAEVLLDASSKLALRDAAGEGKREGGFVVLAMGKMGGREMNYSSDLDIIFLFDGPEGSRDLYTKAAQRLITILTSPTAEGHLYKTDMRLRPSGQAGPLVSTVEAFRRHHQEDAMLWERQAMVKARCVAGDQELAGRIEKLLEELAYSRAVTREDIEEIVRVRSRMEDEIAEEGSGRHYDIKAGPGGIVDVEFAAQMIQLVHGPELTVLRSQSTQQVLTAAREAGLATEKQYNTFHRSYSFFREIENRSQIHQDRSDSRIPRNEEKLRPLARRMGYLEEDGTAKLLADVEGARSQVREAYEEVIEELLRILDKA
jgi:glutamate-ammonia-ligase adenylyltransferase